jgi:NADP-dependent aldehyde dehydrogenase
MRQRRQDVSEGRAELGGFDSDGAYSDQGHNPRTGEPVGAPVPHTSVVEVDRIARAATRAAPALAALAPADRADLLRGIAAGLEAARDDIVALGEAETGLGLPRLGSELTRTRVQLELFAEALGEGSLFEVVIDLADPDALPAPRPDLRRMLVPLGPVAVFAASNFPLAFSVAGGDTASALAAGCPVVVKAHPGHPGLSVLCGQIVAEALQKAGAPAGAFGMVHGVEAGVALVAHPAVTAVGFTGSAAGGRALLEVVGSRRIPIPFYGELGSLNPTVVTPGAVAARGSDIARGFVASYTLGAGQFCTKPGLLFLPEGHGLDGELAAAATAATVGPLLNQNIQRGYALGTEKFAGVPGVRSLLPSSTVEREGYFVAPTLYEVSATNFVAASATLTEECFGPAAIVVTYADPGELAAALAVVPASLTATLHADAEAEPGLVKALLAGFAVRAGRVIWGGWPTGVAVSWAQHHGGPWPATTASVHTSVGVTAVRRFLRPVVFQDLPDSLLPPALRDDNPFDLPRRINGEVRRTAISR